MHELRKVNPFPLNATSLLKYFFLLLQCDSEGDDDKASTLILISLLKTSQLMFLNDIYESRKLIKPVFNSSTLRVGKVETERWK